MQEPIHKMVGRKLLNIRKTRGLSLDQVAELTGVSKAMLGQIERGDSNPTISVLWKIVSGLQISFTSLIEDDEPKITVVRSEDLSSFDEEDGQYRAYPLFPFHPQKSFEIYTVEMEQGCTHASEPHNEGVEEYILMVEGKLQISIAQESYILQPGDAIHFTADRPHTYTNLSDRKAVYKTLIYYPSS
ncbi:MULTISPECIES: helix-turn-helix domain-containing protein [Paenibacillus]|uniref:Helix-turn-helix domain-containing protein n=3 Tax=Paenibacillus TaxID=44249 RepID=A0ABU3R850_9BACL|nr:MULTISPECIES: helix-turn-helix domain-containing protein [Paenibacillus]MBA2941440.1 helix-turn-helix domain-containing protein [Paenibacillus sp. CGMCC 1.16610]MCY9662202.1 helix-turn-helix domain-containing protein [Paenibacillus anseongense]MDU0200450.1 helix-turn-helix domain-containing protein [Paenibacillus sp. PFR10]MEB4795715.1 helix-turn-helix domain-containing protein [Paenibacillus chondroitinus]MEC0265753.1 helix-turn-helix domain-containing protein [Paenibacillus anseongense]